MPPVRRVLDALYLSSGWLAATCIFFVFVVMIGAAGMRQLGIAVKGSNEIVAWLSAGAAFLGLAHTFKHGDHVRVGLLIDRVPERWRTQAEFAILGLSIIFVGFMTWWAMMFTWESYEFGTLADGLLALPVWIPQTSFVVGSALLLLALLDELWAVCAGREPAYLRLPRKRLQAGDFSSEV